MSQIWRGRFWLCPVATILFSMIDSSNYEHFLYFVLFHLRAHIFLVQTAKNFHFFFIQLRYKWPRHFITASSNYQHFLLCPFPIADAFYSFLFQLRALFKLIPVPTADTFYFILFQLPTIFSFVCSNCDGCNYYLLLLLLLLSLPTVKVFDFVLFQLRALLIIAFSRSGHCRHFSLGRS